MTRYATTEKRYKCIRCEILCMMREMNHNATMGDVTSLKCPNCGNLMTFRPAFEWEME